MSISLWSVRSVLWSVRAACPSRAAGRAPGAHAGAGAGPPAPRRRHAANEVRLSSRVSCPRTGHRTTVHARAAGATTRPPSFFGERYPVYIFLLFWHTARGAPRESRRDRMPHYMPQRRQPRAAGPAGTRPAPPPPFRASCVLAPGGGAPARGPSPRYRMRRARRADPDDPRPKASTRIARIAHQLLLQT